jgi:hypothetical protein
MAQFIQYSSADASAPSLTGTAGSLIALLDACLVNGYGAKPGAGWTKAFSGTNVAAYQQGTGSTEFFLRVDDNGPGAGTYKEARITGYETMSDVDTGSNPFPSSTQGVGSNAMVVARKSSTADSTVRQWQLFADERTMYMFVLTDSSNVYFAFMFGEFYSIRNTADNYRCMIVGRSAENSNTAANDTLDRLSGLTSATVGHFAARTYGGTGSSITIGKHGDGVKGSTSALFGSVQYPNGPDNALYMSPVWVVENSSSTIRGRMRGFWQILHPVSNFTNGDVFSGANEFAGKTFTILKSGGNSSIYCIETSNTLETN